MADLENNNLPLNDLSNQFLECPLCLDNYVNPKVLPCQHTFCLNCLKTYVEANRFIPTMSCPICNQNVEIPGKDVTNFKNNFFINGLLNFVNDSLESSQKNERKFSKETSSGETSRVESSSGESLSLCGACCESEALSAYCQVCSLYLCRTCTKAHSRVPATSSHDLLTSQQLDKKCKTEVEKLASFVAEHQNDITSQRELLRDHLCQLPDKIADLQMCIESAAEAAHQVISRKASFLLEKVASFHMEQNGMVRRELARREVEKQRLAEIEELLVSMSLSDDGFKNQMSLKQVQTYIADISNADTFSLLGKVFECSFSAERGIINAMENNNFGYIFKFHKCL